MFQFAVSSAVFAVCAYTDIRGKRVSKRAIIVYFLLAVSGHLIGRSLRILDFALGMLPGVACLLFSWGSQQALGYGDSALILGCGVALGVKHCMGILVWAFFFAGLWAIVQICFLSAGRKKEFPFVPFLFAGIVVEWVLC